MLHLPLLLSHLGFCLNYLILEEEFSVWGAAEWVWEDLKASLAFLTKKKPNPVLAGLKDDL